VEFVAVSRRNTVEHRQRLNEWRGKRLYPNGGNNSVGAARGWLSAAA